MFLEMFAEHSDGGEGLAALLAVIFLLGVPNRAVSLQQLESYELLVAQLARKHLQLVFRVCFLDVSDQFAGDFELQSANWTQRWLPEVFAGFGRAFGAW